MWPNLGSGSLGSTTRSAGLVHGTASPASTAAHPGGGQPAPGLVIAVKGKGYLLEVVELVGFRRTFLAGLLENLLLAFLLDGLLGVFLLGGRRLQLAFFLGWFFEVLLL